MGLRRHPRVRGGTQETSTGKGWGSGGMDKHGKGCGSWVRGVAHG